MSFDIPQPNHDVEETTMKTFSRQTTRQLICGLFVAAFIFGCDSDDNDTNSAGNEAGAGGEAAEAGAGGEAGVVRP